MLLVGASLNAGQISHSSLIYTKASGYFRLFNESFSNSSLGNYYGPCLLSQRFGIFVLCREPKTSLVLNCLKKKLRCFNMYGTCIFLGIRLSH